MTQAGLVTFSTVSTEYVRVGLRYSSTPELGMDPTLLPVYMAFLAPGVTPADADFKVSSWKTENGKVYALCLIGSTPDAVVTLPAGFYNVWLKIVSNPEVLVKMVGSIQVR